jgi:hypothetical protein
MSRVARWFILRPKIPNVWYNVWPFGIVCGIFFPFWYVWSKKNLATLLCSGPANFLVAKQLVKNGYLHPREDNLQWSTKAHFTKYGGYQLKKFLPFSNMFLLGSVGFELVENII